MPHWPKGNAADSDQLVPMVEEVVRRTSVVPRVLSVDDGDDRFPDPDRHARLLAGRPSHPQAHGLGIARHARRGDLHRSRAATPGPGRRSHAAVLAVQRCIACS